MTVAADIIQEVIDQHRFDKDGELLVGNLVGLHLAQSKEGRKAFIEVYRNWLRSGDIIKADWAITLIRRLRVTGELPLLVSVLEEVRAGNSKLPKYFDQFLEPTIDELKAGK